MTQITLFDNSQAEKEDIKQVMTELCRNCDSCRLSLLHPANVGMIWRGSIEAKIAVIGEAPGDTETEMGLPLVGPSGKEWERWAYFLGLDTKRDCFITNVVQCQPRKKEIKEGRKKRLVQQDPESDEIRACFGPRCLRALKAMPNLEAVITLGWVAARTLLGGEPRAKTHEGNWFYTNLLPSIPIFCLVHPAYLLREPSPDKSAKVEHCLRAFRREFLTSDKAKQLAAEAKERYL